MILPVKTWQAGNMGDVMYMRWFIKKQFQETDRFQGQSNHMLFLMGNLEV